MVISLVTVGAKITAALMNLVITEVNSVGTVGVVPTSVAGSGVTVATNGKVSFAASSTVSVNGCFTSEFDNYLIKIHVTAQSAANEWRLRMRNAGTDFTSALYDSQQVQQNGATLASLSTTSNAYWSINANTLGQQGTSEIDIDAPLLASATILQARTYVYPNAATSGIKTDLGAGLRNTSTYDGFTFYPAAGTITGSIRVYGFNNN